MEHYAAVTPGPGRSPAARSRGERSRCSETRLELEVGPASARSTACCSTASTGGCARRGCAPSGRRAARPSALTLHEPGAAGAAGRGRARAALPRRGAARRRRCASASRGVLEERALLPAVRVRSAVQPLARAQRRRQDGRAAGARARPRRCSGGRRVPLAPRLSVRPVLGYDGDYERALARAARRLGLEPARAVAVRRGGDARPAAGPRASRRSPGRARRRGTRTDAAAALVLRAAGRDRRGQRPRHARRPRHRVPARPARVDPARPRRCCASCAACIAPRERARLRDELKWAQALTGPVRDLDVQLLEWDELTARCRASAPPSSSRCARCSRAAARASWPSSARAAQRALRRPCSRAGARWPTAPARRRAGERPSAALPIEAVAGERIRKVYRRMVRDGSAIDDDSPAEALHDLRKRGKELRYLLELFGGAVPGRRGQADGHDAQGPAGRARPLPGPRGADRAAARDCATSSPREPGGPGGADRARARARRAGAPTSRPPATSSPSASPPSPPSRSASSCATRSEQP